MHFHLSNIDQKIVVFEQRLLFELSILRNEQGGYCAWLQIPSRNPDGSYAGHDYFQSVDLEDEQPLLLSCKAIVTGPSDVQITLTPNAQGIDLDLGIPPHWSALDAESFYRTFGDDQR